MKLVKQASQFAFNPLNIVSNDNVFGKRNKETDDIEVSDQKEFADDGIFSKRIFGDIENTNYDYSCECGNLRGKFYEGDICTKCGTEVKYSGNNIDKVGWIDISGDNYDTSGNIISKGPGYKIIKYVAYGFLEKVFGRENLQKIIHVPDTITIDGDLDIESIENERSESPNKKYWYIGLTEFYKNYKEILEYYVAINGISDKRLIDFISSEYDVFTDKIMVLPAVMRPCMRTADGVKLDIINNIYISILKYNNVLNSNNEVLDLVKNSMLESIQAALFQLTQYCFDMIRGKDGIIRNRICGTRIGYSARAIIIPALPEIPMDGIVLPYKIFLELYKFELINVIKKLKNITYTDAEKIIFNAGIKYNSEVYDIMQKIVKDEDCTILLNRKQVGIAA